MGKAQLTDPPAFTDKFSENKQKLDTAISDQVSVVDRVVNNHSRAGEACLDYLGATK
jgi:hypothetical protein